MASVMSLRPHKVRTAQRDWRNMLVSIILYICGYEDIDTVRKTSEMLVSCSDVQYSFGSFDSFDIETEYIAAAAENAPVYAELFGDAGSTAVSGNKAGHDIADGMKFIDLSLRNYQTVAQLKNASLSYASGEYVVFVQPGEIWQEDTFARLIESIAAGHAGEADKDFENLIMAGDSDIGAYAFSKDALCSCGGFNGRLSCGEDFELALRILDGESGASKSVSSDADGEDGTAENAGRDIDIANGAADNSGGAANSGGNAGGMGIGSLNKKSALRKAGFVVDKKAPKPVFQEHYNTYAYIIGRYAARLRADGVFDAALMRYVREAQDFGVQEYFMGLLEKMVSRQKEYYEIDDASRPVLIYMGDPICFDVLISFAHNFADELQKHGIPVIIYDMAKEGTTGLAEFVGGRFRAVVGFQTALFSVRMKNSDELVNNLISAPKINFLYDHPLYLYYHFTLELENYYVLTQDEDYASYINKHYPLIKKSFHLPPAGIELSDSERVRWEDKIYDIVFVASYHDYRERTLALETQTDSQIKPVAKKLLEKMKAEPDMTAEEALAAVLAESGTVVSTNEFGVLLNKCMDACRVVMFYYREKVMETMLDAGLTIHAFGESWKNCPLSCRSNLVIHPDVSYAEGIRIMAQSKIALNVMSWHKAGMTERIANTMLNGTVCLTDKTRYLEKHFRDGKDIVMFELARLDSLPAKVKELLADDARMRSIAAAGYENASKNHRWSDRAESFIDMLDNGVFAE